MTFAKFYLKINILLWNTYGTITLYISIGNTFYKVEKYDVPFQFHQIDIFIIILSKVLSIINQCRDKSIAIKIQYFFDSVPPFSFLKSLSMPITYSIDIKFFFCQSTDIFRGSTFYQNAITYSTNRIGLFQEFSFRNDTSLCFFKDIAILSYHEKYRDRIIY